MLAQCPKQNLRNFRAFLKKAVPEENRLGLYGILLQPLPQTDIVRHPVTPTLIVRPYHFVKFVLTTAVYLPSLQTQTCHNQINRELTGRQSIQNTSKTNLCESTPIFQTAYLQPETQFYVEI